MGAIRRLVAVAIVTLALGAGLGAAQAQETLTFRVQSTYDYKIQIAFFAQANNHVWPGPGQAYSLDDSQTQSFPLACESGDEICYGAWVTGDGSLSWGVGPKNDQGCTSCCFVCGDGDRTPILKLNE